MFELVGLVLGVVLEGVVVGPDPLAGALVVVFGFLVLFWPFVYGEKFVPAVRHFVLRVRVDVQ